MSTDDRSLETSDQGIPSASCAAVAALGSSAGTDKQYQDQSCRDGASPFQKSWKKSQTRETSALRDGDSMDGVESSEPKITVKKENRGPAVEDGGLQEEKVTEPLISSAQNSAPSTLHCSLLEGSTGSVTSGVSIASVSLEGKNRRHLCALCYCGDRSSLGQGELKQFDLVPDETSKEIFAHENILASCKQKSHTKEELLHNSKSPCSPSTQAASELLRTGCDDLSLVGLPDNISVQMLFDPPGHFWVHQRCAEWSEEVSQNEDHVVEHVDKAVFSGSTKCCTHCKHLGATIKCCEESCEHRYHYPCAAGAGTFQDFSSFTLLCPEHIDQALGRYKDDVNCAVCDSPGDLLDQLFCTSCGQHYHGMCLDISVTSLKRAGWQCPDCKICQTCRHSGDDTQMLVCDTCDKGYHTYCLQPVMDSVPASAWRCRNCRICTECGTRTSSHWHHNSLCDECYQQQDTRLVCPLCGKVYHPETLKNMLQCQKCKRWIHLDCGKITRTGETSQLKEYICTVCKPSKLDLTQPCSTNQSSELALEPETASCINQMNTERKADHEVEVSLQAEKEQSAELGSTQDQETDKLEPDISQSVETSSTQIKQTETVDSSDVNVTQVTITDEMLRLQQEESEQTVKQDDSVLEVEVKKSDVVEVNLAKVAHPAQETGEKVGISVSVEDDYTEKMDCEISPRSACSVHAEMETTSETSSKMDSPTELYTFKQSSESSPTLTISTDSNKTVVSPPFIASGFLSPYSWSPSASVTLSICTTNASTPSHVYTTPKIGMGKPAISKRKFSPGRPRVKQGACSTSNAMSLFSWSPGSSDGLDTLKARQPFNSTIWSIKVGRGSGFPGRRRPRGSSLSGRGGRGRSKWKSGIGAFITPGVSVLNVPLYKEEEETIMRNTVVLFSSNDRFTSQQDMCLVCGSFGKGAEGRFISCSQCGQCYHPYCVNIKITKVILSKGWRCLECTVCEACGNATDPARLLLCDDCDISYHTYCLDPPLQTVPKGGWKCKWCVCCTHCGATSPGLRCEWQNNYTQCAPCASLATCPVCLQNYKEEELIVQCRQCDRWIHSRCQDLNTEEELENAAEGGLDCTFCRPYLTPTHVTPSDDCEVSVVPQVVAKAKDPDPPRMYTQDGVCLTELGMNHLQRITVTIPRKKRPKPKLKLKIINQNSVAVLQTPPDFQSEHSRDGDMDDSREGDLMDGDGKSDSSLEREAPEAESKRDEGTNEIKKRKRKPYRPGIGGFMVRQRSRTGQGKTKRLLSWKDSSGSVPEQITGWTERLPDAPFDDSALKSESPEKNKKRYRKKKNKLGEMFPVYLQEAFFGKELLDTSKQNSLTSDTLSESFHLTNKSANVKSSLLDPSSDPLLSAATALGPASHDKQGDHSEVSNTEEDFLGIFSNEVVKSGKGSATLDIGPVSDDSPSTIPPAGVQTTRPLCEQLDGILSPELDKIVTDGAVLGKMYKIPELEGKDVEELFTAVLSPTATQPPPLPQPPHPMLPVQNQGDPVFPRLPLMNGVVGPNSHLVVTSMTTGGRTCLTNSFSSISSASSSFLNSREKNPAFSPLVNDPNNTWTAPAPVVDGESDTMSSAQRSTLKWEKEEALGEMATVAPVLYTNVKFPNLKEDFPDWSTRVKQIAKLWRKASSQERAPFVQKARDNRAALRINKVQMSSDTMKRQQHQDNTDQSTRLDSELFRDPLKQKESEHEQEWKFRQQMRQKSKQQAKIEATQKLEQVKNEQQQQQQFSAQSFLNNSGDSPNTSVHSPLSTRQGDGSMSPAQQTSHKDMFVKHQLSSTPTSSGDVFLKPQAPPPTPTRISGLDHIPQSQNSQPQSPQMFSPGSSSSRSSSPLDVNVKMMATTHQQLAGQSFVRRNSCSPVDPCTPPSAVSIPTQVTERVGSSRPSPVRDSFGSPKTGDSCAKPSDASRPVMLPDKFPKPLEIPGAHFNVEPPSVAAVGNSFSVLPSRTDIFQRQQMPSNIVVSPDSLTRISLVPEIGLGHFKTLMHPPDSVKDTYTSVPPTPRRMSVDSYENSVSAPRQADPFTQNSSADPYIQACVPSHTVVNESVVQPQRVIQPAQNDCLTQSGQVSRAFTQDSCSQSSGNSQTVADPYVQLQHTPRLSSVDSYSHHSPASRPSAQPLDPYAQPSLTSRFAMGEQFMQSSVNHRLAEPNLQSHGTSRAIANDRFTPASATSKSGISEPYSRPVISRPSAIPDQNAFLQVVQGSDSHLQDTFVRPADLCPQTLRPAGSTTSDALNQVSQTPTHDSYDHRRRTSQHQSGDDFVSVHLANDADDQKGTCSEMDCGTSSSPLNSQGQQFTYSAQVPGSAVSGIVSDTQSLVSQADTEEKFRQRQKIRELILRQHQQKKSGRLEKEPMVSSSAGPVQQWQQEDLNRLNEPYNRPPPPYPGSIRTALVAPGSQRFSLFQKDLYATFAVDGQFSRPHFPGNIVTMGPRPPGFRYAFPAHGPGPECFHGPPQQMQGTGLPQQLKRPISVDTSGSLSNPQVNNHFGIPSHYPPQGITLQQHNIQGQPFIELRHRPIDRPRFPFTTSTNAADPACQQQKVEGFIIEQNLRFPSNLGMRPIDTVMKQQLQDGNSEMHVPSNIGHLPQHRLQIHADHQPVTQSPSLSHPLGDSVITALPAAPSAASSDTIDDLPISSEETDDLEEKLDHVKDLDDVKDLDGVEVKDLDDEDLDNLNLDPEDEKGDDLDNLDSLETNDPHLDVFLAAGEFDIIAYTTDPDLDLTDKKDMFSEELDLHDPVNDSIGNQITSEEKKEQVNETAISPKAVCNSKDILSKGSNSSTSSANLHDIEQMENGNCSMGVCPVSESGSAETELNGKKALVKSSEQNIQDESAAHEDAADSTVKNVLRSSPIHGQDKTSPCNLSTSSPLLSGLECSEKADQSVNEPLNSPSQVLTSAHSNHVSGTPQASNSVVSPEQITDRTVTPELSVGPGLDHSFSQAADINSSFSQEQPSSHGFGVQAVSQDVSVSNIQGQIDASVSQHISFPQAIGQTNRERPLLLEEQPLLLQDLLDQERQEQQQQRQMQAMIRQRSEPFFPNIDFDAITDPIMKAKMVALQGINKVMAQNNMPTVVINSRFPFVSQQMPGPPPGEELVDIQGTGQDGCFPQQIARPNPPSFGPGFVNDAQRKQYEEWLQETQQLLQMQQKFLEEQIGVHRKSKKALSAKQRTAKKAGREFPEEDAEQLKHVTEQQSMVQKQLEQIRKQQKEHAELIEEYRIKHPTLCGMASTPAIQAQASVIAGSQPQVINQHNFPLIPQQQHITVIPGKANPPRMPGLTVWQPPNVASSHIPVVTQRIPVNASQMSVNCATTASGANVISNAQSNVPPVVEFEDNNPFSEGFQERERKERLREQQERQRIQLMQEVDRQRALQQRLEMEQHQQQGIMGNDLNQMSLNDPLFNPGLAQDFSHSARTDLQQPTGQLLSQQNLQGFSPPSTTLAQGGEQRSIRLSIYGPETNVDSSMRINSHVAKQIPRNISGSGFIHGQQRSSFNTALPHGTVDGAVVIQDSVKALPPGCPDPSQSFTHLYSNIIPEEKCKKKKTKRKKKDEDGDSIKTPSTPHSDITAPPTPSICESVSLEVNNPGDRMVPRGKSEFSGSPLTPTTKANRSSLEHECLPSDIDKQHLVQSTVNSDPCQYQTKDFSDMHKVKVEQEETTPCQSHIASVVGTQSKIKPEDKNVVPHNSFFIGQSPSTLQESKTELGNELLKHLLKYKNESDLPHQKSGESILSMDDGCLEGKVPEQQNEFDMVQDTHICNVGLQKSNGEQDRKKTRNKRVQNTGEKTLSRYKKKKKEEEERLSMYSSADTLRQLKQQLCLLPLVEPIIEVNFAHFAPFGSDHLNGDSRLTGKFGSATLDGASDYYSQLIYKQNNLSNPPTPPASLPPTPPPMARQKMVNGFATTDELTGRPGILGHDVSKAFVHRPFHLPFRPDDDLLAKAMAQGHKTVDVPASLPTPPHNNLEELRGQDHCDDRDTPDSYVPSSSPESVVGMEINRYPDLSLVKEEPPDPASSPVIPILPSSTGKGSQAQHNIKMESASRTFKFGSPFGQPTDSPHAGLISVALTLNPSASENINEVVAAVAELLHVKIPNSYEVSDILETPTLTLLKQQRISQGLESRSHLLINGAHVRPAGSLKFAGCSSFTQPPFRFPSTGCGATFGKNNHQSVPGSPIHKPQWCCQCKVVILGSGVRKSIKDLPSFKQDPSESRNKAENNLVFCSNNCFVLYSVSSRLKTSDNKDNVMPLLLESPEKDPLPKVFHQYSNNTSSMDVHCLPRLKEKVSPPSTPPVTFPTASFGIAKTEVKTDELKVTVKLKPRPRTVQSGLDEYSPAIKKCKGMRWMKWNVQIVIPKATFKPPCDIEIDALLKKLGTSIRPQPVPRDCRKCCFCHEEGDGLTDGPARLLNLDLDIWVHLNCALWSTEVYETQSGALINVELALRRGLHMKCVFCHKIGATSSCHRLRCTNVYHFTCAFKAQCMFFKDKTMLCPLHKPKGCHEQELNYFAVFRRVYIQRDEVRQIASIVQRGERDHTFRVGSLIFHSIGQLLPHQMQAFHSSTALFPVGYEASRLYWSMRYINRRCRYLCGIEEKDGLPEFVIKVIEQGHEDLILKDTSPKGVWDKILEPIAELRKDSSILKLFPVYIKGEDLFGLTVPAVARIAESLPGVETCGNYTFRYGRNPLMESPVAVNPTGSARSEPKMNNHVKRFVLRSHTLNSTSTSKSFQSTVTGELSAPYSKQFVHSKSSQYRKMKSEWKSNVYLARSHIQGLGLFAARDIEKHTMVIEYIGTVIRNEVANRKEKLYESQNRGVYMFRIDNEHVIDATLTGGPARYINHSCAPNCVAEVVAFEKGHKIIISSNRRIQKGEELCYDYKFDFEDDQHKIPCHCGALNCRKWMN
ncbi:histone-lysine N-methyltransferase 2C [Protopterus annectens]|uniref:histone-lysine N-methyltransferase 2C n=1 Tax=Protopterus annectens TaxID=7888 RepID=UPI001CFC3616|nr:histone-lysine N-methyltransferase 2C [Protopterus annectens]